jgi:hypothetical protein
MVTNVAGSYCLDQNTRQIQPEMDHVANGKADAGARLVTEVEVTNDVKRLTTCYINCQIAVKLIA